MKQQIITRNVPVYHVCVEEDELQIKPHPQVVDVIFTVTPEMAVNALRNHNVGYLYVPMQNGTIEELKRRWAGKVPSVNLPNAVAALREAYLNQQGDLIFVPRSVVADMIERMGDTRTRHVDLLLEGEHLTPIEARIVARLMDVPGVPVSQRIICAESRCSAESLWVHIRRLRDKLDPNRAHLRTVRDVGYYMEVSDNEFIPASHSSILCPECEAKKNSEDGS